MTQNIIDKFKDALNSINKEIEKQTKLRSNLPIQSKEYRNSLEEEIRLERNKTNILKEYQNALIQEIESSN